jgi:hypothetical protein
MAWTAVYFYSLKFAMPRMPWARTDAGFKDEAVGSGITYSIDTQLVGIDYVFFGGSGFPDFDHEAVREYNETKRIKAKVEDSRKKAISMRVDDLSFLGSRSSEGSWHGGRGGNADSSVHGGRGTAESSFHGGNNNVSLFKSSARTSLIIETPAGSNETTPNVTPRASPKGAVTAAMEFFSAIPENFARTSSFTGNAPTLGPGSTTGTGTVGNKQ